MKNLPPETPISGIDGKSKTTVIVTTDEVSKSIVIDPPTMKDKRDGRIEVTMKTSDGTPVLRLVWPPYQENIVFDDKSPGQPMAVQPVKGFANEAEYRAMIAREAALHARARILRSSDE